MNAPENSSVNPDMNLPETMPDPAPPARPPEPWRRRLIRKLLYGENVDRGVKAKARVGLALVAFAVIYAVIGGRLMVYAVAPGHSSGAGAAQERTATARPDILDRNGMILATDVRTPSLFAEPRRIIDPDEATELLTGVLPELDSRDLRARLGTDRGFIWLKREITPQQQRDIHRLGLPGIGFLVENKRAYPNHAEVSHVIGHVNVDNQGIAGIENWLDKRGLAALHMAGFAGRPAAKAGRTGARPAGAACAARRTDRGGGEVQGEGRLRPRLGCAHRRDRRHGLAARLRSQPARSRPTIRPGSTG